jgi:hypothetical protein
MTGQYEQAIQQTSADDTNEKTNSKHPLLYNTANRDNHDYPSNGWSDRQV